MSGRRVWPYLSPLGRVLWVVFFPLVLVAWGSVWLICGVPAIILRERP